MNNDSILGTENNQNTVNNNTVPTINPVSPVSNQSVSENLTPGIVEQTNLIQSVPNIQSAPNINQSSLNSTSAVSMVGSNIANPAPVVQPTDSISVAPAVQNDMTTVTPAPAVNSTESVTQVQTEILQSPTTTVGTQISEPMTPATPVSTSEPVAIPIPGTEGLTGNTVSSGTSPSSNLIMSKSGGDNIGIVPPDKEQPSKKNPKMNKIIFIVGIVVLMGLIAFGVYFFLNKSAKEIKLSLKTVELSIGDNVSYKLTDYATITGGDTSSCKIDNSNIDTSKEGEYKFKIVCDKKTFDGGKVIVKDKVAPKLLVNVLFKSVNDTVKKEDFITSCTDLSTCTTDFLNESEFNNNAKTIGGPHNVAIKATDKSGNETIENAQMYVINDQIRLYSLCEKPIQRIDGYSASKVVEDIHPLGLTTDLLGYLGYSVRVYTYVFDLESEYLNVIGDKPATIKFDNVEGIAKYTDNEKRLTIITDLRKESLDSEFEGSFPFALNSFKSLYEAKGYRCGLITYTQDTKIIDYHPIDK